MTTDICYRVLKKLRLNFFMKLGEPIGYTVIFRACGYINFHHQVVNSHRLVRKPK